MFEKIQEFLRRYFEQKFFFFFFCIDTLNIIKPCQKYYYNCLQEIKKKKQYAKN